MARCRFQLFSTVFVERLPGEDEVLEWGFREIRVALRGFSKAFMRLFKCSTWFVSFYLHFGMPPKTLNP